MKKLLILITTTLLFTSIVKGQDELIKIELPLNDKNRIEFIDVIEIPNKSKQELFLLSKEWIAENYNSANDVIQMEDKDAGKIIVKGIFVHTDKAWGIDYQYHHTLKIETKDNKVRIILGDLNLKYTTMNVTIEKQAEELIIDDLYKKNGKPNKGAKEHKEAVINFWENTKKSIVKKLSIDNENTW